MKFVPKYRYLLPEVFVDHFPRDAPVFKHDGALGGLGYLRVVGYDNERGSFVVKLAEEIRYADPKPTSMDGEIAQMLETLSSYADAANIKKAFLMMEQRKALGKAEK